MEHKTLPLDLLDGHKQNYRQHPDEQITHIGASLARFHQVRSIVIAPEPNGRYTILAGHGVVEAARRNTIEQVACDIVPAEWDEVTRRAYIVADNNLSNGASDDSAMLAQFLQEQVDAGYDLASLGSDEETLRQMLSELGDEYLGNDEQSTMEEETEDVSLSDQDKRLFSLDMIASTAYQYFRSTGFPYRKLPLYMCMQEINKLARLDNEKLLHSNLGYHVADTYHPHRFHSSAENMWSPYKAFHDDKRLNKTFQLYLGELGSGIVPLDILGNLCVVSTTQACANFRPGFAMHLYKKYCQPEAVVLDTSTGYGGRLIGFIASGLAGTYIGIDPNTVTHEGNQHMASDLYFSENVELHNMPAEDVDHDVVRNRCDFAFTSPPYFAKEHYSDEDTQSWKRYGTGDAWRTGFLQKMLALQYAALKPGSHAIVNIADVQLRGEWYPLAQWTIEDGKSAGFTHVETLEFPLNRRFGEGHTDEVAMEPVIVFRKEVSHA